MKELISNVNEILKPVGYRKNGSSFWKIDHGIYKLINFQKGAYHADYFFINLCVHPIGLPKLLSQKLSIIEKPKEYECIVRQRIEQVVKNDFTDKFRRGFVFNSDSEIIHSLRDCLPNEVDGWLNYWGTFQRLCNSKKDEILPMLTVVPKLKEKAFYMLKFYCCLKTSNLKEAVSFLNQYLSIEIKGTDFNILDEYLKSLINNQISKK